MTPVQKTTARRLRKGFTLMEILVAVAIVGGLISSTLLDLVVTPAVFFLLGRKAAENALRLDAPAAR